MSQRSWTAAAMLLGFILAPGAADAATAAQIDRGVDAAIDRCYTRVNGCKMLGEQAKGMLVFPRVTKVGVGVGGSYGVGALRIDGQTVGYYSTTGASLGLQLGAQKHSEMILFLTDDALNRFRTSSGWQVGGDASVTVIDQGSANNAASITQNAPVVAFIFGETGLMGSLSLEGAKISHYSPE